MPILLAALALAAGITAVTYAALTGRDHDTRRRT